MTLTPAEAEDEFEDDDAMDHACCFWCDMPIKGDPIRHDDEPFCSHVCVNAYERDAIEFD